MWQKLMRFVSSGSKRERSLESGAKLRTFSGNIEVVSWASHTEELPILSEEEVTTPRKAHEMSGEGRS